MRKQVTAQEFYNTIEEYLNSTGIGGRTTEEVSEHYGISKGRVGSLMAILSRKGLVFTYGRGIIVLNHGFHNTKGTPMRITYSFYEWIGKPEDNG